MKNLFEKVMNVFTSRKTTKKQHDDFVVQQFRRIDEQIRESAAREESMKEFADYWEKKIQENRDWLANAEKERVNS